MLFMYMNPFLFFFSFYLLQKVSGLIYMTDFGFGYDINHTVLYKKKVVCIYAKHGHISKLYSVSQKYYYFS